jgi:hypothetical protein
VRQLEMSVVDGMIEQELRYVWGIGKVRTQPRLRLAPGAHSCLYACRNLLSFGPLQRRYEASPHQNPRVRGLRSGNG